ncbi:MAG: insulinase family protein, partial [candidate division Zixibacteria bacterium]|nr:insulinase family protein [candidate division Zixibacteria bacterium]
MLRRMLTVIAMSALLLAFAVPVLQADDIDIEKIQFPKLNKIEIPDIEKITLDNGMRVYLLEDHEYPLFEASVRVAGGSYLEPADKVGLAGICGTVMRTGGTARWTGDEIDEMLEGVGGTVE